MQRNTLFLSLTVEKFRGSLASWFNFLRSTLWSLDERLVSRRAGSVVSGQSAGAPGLDFEGPPWPAGRLPPEESPTLKPAKAPDQMPKPHDFFTPYTKVNPA
jgi:hypothetical protein